MKQKLKWLIIGAIILLVAFLVAFGIYKNPDRKNREANTEYEKIAGEMGKNGLELKNLASQNSKCFTNNEYEEDYQMADSCLIAIKSLLSLFDADQKNILNLENFYKVNKDKIDNEQEVFIENTIKLSSSKQYSDIMLAYKTYFENYLDQFNFIKQSGSELKNLSNERLTHLRGIFMKNYENGENLEKSRSTFNDYLAQNFDEKFISAAKQFYQ